MPCDEAFYRHFHKKHHHTHPHQHEEHHPHQHDRKEKSGQQPDLHDHQHQEVLHNHPYKHDDPHHSSELIQVGVAVHVLENRKEQLVLEDVDFIEFDDDQVVIHNILGNEKILTARLKRVHFVDRGKVIMLLEK